MSAACSLPCAVTFGSFAAFAVVFAIIIVGLVSLTVVSPTVALSIWVGSLLVISVSYLSTTLYFDARVRANPIIGPAPLAPTLNEYVAAKRYALHVYPNASWFGTASPRLVVAYVKQLGFYYRNDADLGFLDDITSMIPALQDQVANAPCPDGDCCPHDWGGLSKTEPAFCTGSPPGTCDYALAVRGESGMLPALPGLYWLSSMMSRFSKGLYSKLIFRNVYDPQNWRAAIAAAPEVTVAKHLGWNDGAIALNLGGYPSHQAVEVARVRSLSWAPATFYYGAAGSGNFLKLGRTQRGCDKVETGLKVISMAARNGFRGFVNKPVRFGADFADSGPSVTPASSFKDHPSYLLYELLQGIGQYGDTSVVRPPQGPGIQFSLSIPNDAVRDFCNGINVWNNHTGPRANKCNLPQVPHGAPVPFVSSFRADAGMVDSFGLFSWFFSTVCEVALPSDWSAKAVVSAAWSLEQRAALESFFACVTSTDKLKTELSWAARYVMNRVANADSFDYALLPFMRFTPAVQTIPANWPGLMLKHKLDTIQFSIQPNGDAGWGYEVADYRFSMADATRGRSGDRTRSGDSKLPTPNAIEQWDTYTRAYMFEGTPFAKDGAGFTAPCEFQFSDELQFDVSFCKRKVIPGDSLIVPHKRASPVRWRSGAGNFAISPSALGQVPDLPRSGTFSVDAKRTVLGKHVFPQDEGGAWQCWRNALWTLIEDPMLGPTIQQIRLLFVQAKPELGHLAQDAGDYMRVMWVHKLDAPLVDTRDYAVTIWRNGEEVTAQVVWQYNNITNGFVDVILNDQLPESYDASRAAVLTNGELHAPTGGKAYAYCFHVKLHPWQSGRARYTYQIRYKESAMRQDTFMWGKRSDGKLRMLCTGDCSMDDTRSPFRWAYKEKYGKAARYQDGAKDAYPFGIGGWVPSADIKSVDHCTYWSQPVCDTLVSEVIGVDRDNVYDKADFFIHTGDFSYAVNYPENSFVMLMWEPIFRKIPVLTTPGNHCLKVADPAYSLAGPCGMVYMLQFPHHWQLPSCVQGPHTVFAGKRSFEIRRVNVPPSKDSCMTCFTNEDKTKCVLPGSEEAPIDAPKPTAIWGDCTECFYNKHSPPPGGRKGEVNPYVPHGAYKNQFDSQGYFVYSLTLGEEIFLLSSLEAGDEHDTVPDLGDNGAVFRPLYEAVVSEAAGLAAYRKVALGHQIINLGLNLAGLPFELAVGGHIHGTSIWGRYGLTGLKTPILLAGGAGKSEDDSYPIGDGAGFVIVAMDLNAQIDKPYHTYEEYIVCPLEGCTNGAAKFPDDSGPQPCAARSCNYSRAGEFAGVDNPQPGGCDTYELIVADVDQVRKRFADLQSGYGGVATPMNAPYGDFSRKPDKAPRCWFQKQSEFCSTQREYNEEDRPVQGTLRIARLGPHQRLQSTISAKIAARQMQDRIVRPVTATGDSMGPMRADVYKESWHDASHK